MLGESAFGLLVEADQLVELTDVALEDADIVGDERQRVVDLVGDARHHSTERRELLGLNELALGPLEVLVGLAYGGGGDLQVGGQSSQLRV